MTLTPLPRVARPVDAVVERLRREILSGTFPAGEHLPPERTLAAQLGISRLTLRAGLARLEAEGLVRARQGDGVRVLAVEEHATLGVLAHLDLSQRPDVLRSFLELRRAVAIEAVAAACQRASKKSIAALEKLAEEQALETDDARYAARDIEFARGVLRAAGSFAALLLFNTLAPVYAAHPEVARALAADREKSLDGYDVTLSLLRTGDPALARTVLRAALEAVDDAALRTLARRRRA